jgi:N-acetylglucosamine kinase-like BadF-type ATPase
MTASATASPAAATPPAPEAGLGLGLALGLGLDAGGTQTRWAVADTEGRIRAEGSAAPLSGAPGADAAGRAPLAATLHAIAQAAGPVGAVVAGLTGLAETQVPAWAALAAAAFQVASTEVHVLSDIEALCRAAFAPGAGFVVYAGTGSIAAFVDETGRLQRAGGRGAVIDDAGGGHWIAREALRHIWRAEDEAPGAWTGSPLARHVFAHIGGSDWAATRDWVYGATRGELGTLALAVAAAADEDPAALALLQAAGAELARLGAALVRRHGLHPLALAGRVFDLHPAVENALRATLPTGCAVHRLATPAHHAAARRAALAATRKPA